MMGTTIFMVGAILISNAVIVALLLRDSKGKAKYVPKSDDAKGQEPEKDTTDATHTPKAGIGKSTFSIEDFEKRMLETVATSVKEMLPVMIEDAIGELKLKDVEFAEEQTATRNNSEQAGDRNFHPLSKDETEAAFDTDIRDIVDDEPAVPSANGATLDELEAAVDTAMSDKATPEQQASAGKVLSELQDTELFERITENDDIDRRVNMCIKMSIRADISIKNRNPKTPDAVKKAVSKIVIADNIDDFNPADLL